MSFATTFLGAFLALGLTYVYDRRKARLAEQEDRRKVLNTVRVELEGALQRITRFFQQESDAFDTLQSDVNASKSKGTGHLAVIPDVRLDRIAMDTAIFSGKLFLLNEETLELLSETYRRIDVVNRSSDELRVIARSPLTSEHMPMVQGLVATGRGTMSNLQQSLSQALPKLVAEVR